MDRFAAMHTFVAVADANGFTAAAKKLKLSTPAVTRQVAALESQLGLRLLHRTTRKVTLTDAGRRYLEQARRILHDVEQAEAAAQAERVSPAGRFVVTAPTLFGRLHVAPLVSQLVLRFPAVRAELLLTDAVLPLVDDGIDLAVRIGHLADSSLVAKRLGATRRLRVCAPKYLSGRKRPRTLADLAKHELIHLAALEPKAPFPARFTTNSPDAAIAHALRGGGITVALGYQVAEHVAAGRLVTVLEELEPQAVPIQLVYPSARQLSANVRAFFELVDSAKRDLVAL